MSIRSLTQEEAEGRSALIDVTRYDISVDLTGLPTGPEVRCTSTTTFNCTQPGASTFVDCVADVVAATLNGTPVGRAEDGRITLTDLWSENVLVVESVQADTTEGEGVHRCVDPADGEVYLWMSFEPDEARHVWACFDQPDLKAPHAFTVTAPAAWIVLSNTGVADVTGDGDTRTWAFPDTPPLSVYNTVVNAGPFHEVRREAGRYDLGIFARASFADRLERDADEIFRLTEQGLTFFGEMFSMPFPQRKYDQVFVPELGGAMENFGCVTWSDHFLRSTAPTYAENEELASYLLHEMAHMWFGNIVTMRWWDDLWLNEAFADFAGKWASERATTYVDSGAGFLINWKLSAYLADQGPTSHPIRMPVKDVAQAASIFDSITYPKGASVLTQLMTYVGEDAFRAGMGAYFAKHAWQNTTLQDLVDALSESSGRDLDVWREGWLETAGADRLVLEHDGESHALLAAGPGDHGPRPHVVDIGSYRREGDGLVLAATTRVAVESERTPIDLPPADVYLVNDDDLTFATSRPDAGTRDALVAHAGLLPTPVSRAVAVATVYDMLATGEATAAEMVGCLTDVLAREHSGSVIEPYLRIAADVAEWWAGDLDRTALQAKVAATCRHLAAHPEHRVEALRTLARTAADLLEVAHLQEEAGHDIDLHWRVLTRKAELGGETDGEAEVLLEMDPDPEAWIHALAVTAARPDADAKAEAWRRVAVERSVPVGEAAVVTRGFWRPGQEHVLAPYADRFLELLPDLHRGGMIHGMAFTHRLFPMYAVDEAFLDRAVDACADGVMPVVSKTVADRADVVRRMLRSRG